MDKQKGIIVSPEEIKRQQDIIENFKIYNEGKNRKYIVTTYGCQMNEHDSEVLSGMLENMGYIATNDKETADLIIYNTCCVRENAELKVYGNLGALKNLKRRKNDLIIVVCGCMMQQPHVVEKIRNKYKHVDLIFGTHNLFRFPELLAKSMESENMFIEVWENESNVIEGLPASRKHKIKAFINIMYGCNNFCTYCIVPYTRGRERSRDMDDVVKEATILAQSGTKEIMLLGQNVNSYGKTLNMDADFSDLLRELDKVPGIERIRFMTSHPKDLSDRLIDAMAECDRVCEHLHLPFQSGSDRILKIMNRKYTKKGYLTLVGKLKEKIPDIRLTTDIIVGFPGETEEDFEHTLDIVEKVRYDSAFTFLYSVRQGTPAAKMKGQIDRETKQNRFDRLLKSVNKISADINGGYLNRVVEVLVEGPSKTDPDRLTGRTRGNKLINFDGTEDLIGQLVQVQIIEAKTFSLNGRIVG